MRSEWTDAGQGWEAKESTLRLEGWSRQRRIIVLRRRVKGVLAASWNETLGQQRLSFIEVGSNTEVYEYSVLATSLDEELASFGQLYRDRGDSENIFDELKNQWGWGGFTTHDLARRPLLLHAIATRVRHARQTTITVASSHAKTVPAARALARSPIFYAPSRKMRSS